MRNPTRFLGILALLGFLFGPLSSFAAGGDGVAALEKIAARFATLDAFLKDKNGRREYEEALTKYYGRTQFPCDSFNEVVDQVRRWVEADPSVGEKLWARMKTWEYEVSWKAKASKVKEDYRFVSLPRKFHGIWLDFSQAGCSEGVCPPLRKSAPGRWAAALDGTAVFHLEKGERFSGTSLMVVDMLRGDKRVRLVASPSSGFLMSKGTANGKPRTLLQDWALAAGGKTPIAFTDSGDRLRPLGKAKVDGKVAGLKYRDELADTLMAVQPPKCIAAEKGTAIKDTTASTGGAGAGSASSGGSAATAVNPNNALGAVLLALNTPPAQAAAPLENKRPLEKSLGDQLQKSPDPKKRAMAALALDLLGKAAAPEPKFPPGVPKPISARAPGYLDGFSPSTRSALRKALRDPSPPVRTQAALALSAAGNSRNAGHSDGLPRDIASALKDINKTLKEAALAPEKSAIEGSGLVGGLLSRDTVDRRSVQELIRQGQLLPPAVEDRLWQQAGKGETPEVRKETVESLVESYMDINAKPDDPNRFAYGQASIANLQARLDRNPELFDEFVKTMNNPDADLCKECFGPPPLYRPLPKVAFETSVEE